MALDKENVLYNKAFSFAIRVVKLHQWMNAEKKEFVISKQLLLCGTSIGANVTEANGTISKLDFSSKISIVYKESLETKYWLALLKETKYVDEKSYDS